MSPASRVLAQVRPASALRGAGVALACLSPRFPGRARVVAASYAASWPLGKPGIQLAIVVPDADADAWKRAAYPLVSSGASWTAVVLGLAAVVRRSRVPTPVAGVLLGAAVAIGDTRMIEFGERMKAKRAAAAVARDA
jgi:hypothetical protein